jgi:hypothetical protein
MYVFKTSFNFIKEEKVKWTYYIEVHEAIAKL